MIDGSARWVEVAARKGDRMRKLTIAVAAAAGLAGCDIYRKAAPGKGRSPSPAVAVEVEEVRKTTVRDVATFTGTLHSRSRFIVAPKVPGRLKRLHVDICDPVKRDQLVAELDDAEYVQQLAQARAELGVARANLEGCRSALEFARREFERTKALSRREFSSESELDAAEAEYKGRLAGHQIALARVVEKEAALKAAEVRLSYTRIRASWEPGERERREPDERLVGERFVDEGEMLRANAPIVSVIDIASVTAVVHVVEREYSRMRVGHEASLSTDAFPGRTFSGKVVRMAPLLKETSRQARVEIDIKNPDLALKPGMFVTARVVFGTRDNATVVPTDALSRRDGRRGVFLVDAAGEKVSFVPVTVGIINRDLAEVLEPELSGLVVTLGQHLLEDGSPVMLSAREPGTSPAAPGQDGRPGKTDGHTGTRR